ncbi:MAG: pyridoxamine 5'-phosphate oxidase family protein, partial [Candidatus Korarchaeota archaeon]|nr:pyridoxamine 5'-phosphate oxidase family protein [Candidatus Korarchaeota archaeon]
MRRKDKEIRDLEEIEEILRRAFVCRIALCEDDRPYCVPMIYCYKEGAIYLHSAKEGKKLEVLKKNNRICFEVEMDVGLVTEGRP